MNRLPLSFVAFAGFGIFWGVWGAALPALRQTAGVSDAQLGGALLCVGLGALPAMLFTGRAVDRFGTRITGLLLVTLAVAGIIVAAFARDIVAVCVGMLLVGATSGASDVAANALAGGEEARSGRRIITLAHAVFSSFVVVGSLGAGAIFASGGGAPLIFLVSGLVILTSGVVVFARGTRTTTGTHARTGTRAASGTGRTTNTMRSRQTLLLPFIIVGLVGALGFAAENAHQSWGAIYLVDELKASPALAAIAPATFAACAAITRFAVGFSPRIPAVALLIGGAAIAVIGTLVVAAAENVGVALLGLALAAIGTSVLFPTLLSQAVRGIDDDVRGSTTSIIATTAYIGFLLGPVYVGLLSSAVGLRGSMIGVTVLVALFGVLAPLVLRRQLLRESDRPQPSSSTSARCAP
ncbi:MFS transporter [Agreia sp. VKM Ac-1783]|uniref:MFS transporter n=1 Tax=Agreia sp. VKM Ac-1783 TaxID=1938889 RepID=UPI000A2AD8FB|nr:MFS transporter [Agreia sp. VKM Ac-1783]SMQ68527.1 Fucose permease [Agreia sp. VKM Ac-1783]